jgi:hypothetical protein
MVTRETTRRNDVRRPSAGPPAGAPGPRTVRAGIPLRPDASRRRLFAMACTAALLALGAGAGMWPGQAQAQERALVFLTVKQGAQQAGGGSLFDTIAANHGALQDDRTVTRRGIELDIYAVTQHKYGLAVGLEVMDYDKTFHFADPNGVLPAERIRIDARSFLYTLKGFLRYGDFLPFIGIGTGTYYVSYNEEVSGLSFLDSANNVLAYRAGFRWLMAGRLGLLVEVGEISAPIRVNSNNTTSTLELGGSFWSAGLSYVW